MKACISLLAFVLYCFVVEAKLKDGDCEVCVKFLTKLNKRLVESRTGGSEDQVELELLKICREAKGKEERLCYYIGASDIAATRLVKSVTIPMSFSKPVEKICEALKKKDAQICELKYEKEIDFDTVDLKKLRVKELKKILTNWGEDCRGCVEKNEFIDRINSVKVKYL